MGGKKSKAPKPDYKAMARNLAQWVHEDRSWREGALAEATNVHNRELSRAKARYGASGGSPDKIAEIEAEHQRKLKKTQEDIETRYAEKQRTVREGPTYRELMKRFINERSYEIGEQFRQEMIGARAESIKTRNQNFNVDRFQKEFQKKFESEHGVRLAKVPKWGGDHQTTSAPDRYRAAILPGSNLASEEAFENWTREYGGFKEPEARTEEYEEIKTRQGERPRAPITGTIPIEENPWI